MNRVNFPIVSPDPLCPAYLAMSRMNATDGPFA